MNKKYAYYVGNNKAIRHKRYPKEVIERDLKELVKAFE